MAILTISILPIHEHGYISIYLFHLQFLLLLFYSFQSIGLSSPWLDLFPGYILFNAVINGFVFLTSFYASLLCIYRKTADSIYLFIFYPATLLLNK